MNIREIAHLAGIGKTYYHSYWSYSNRPSQHLIELINKNKFIFIHIPKSAGMSVQRMLFNSDVHYGHPPAIAYLSRHPKQFNEFFTFSLLREPLDRFVSAFYFLKGSGIAKKDAVWAEQVLTPYATPDELIDAMRQDWLLWARVASWVHFTPQSWYVTDRSGNVVVDFLGSVERFDESMTEVFQRLDREYRPARENASKRPGELALSPDSRAFLERLYADDLRLYHARFGDGQTHSGARPARLN